jgi:hypothetical protein
MAGATRKRPKTAPTSAPETAFEVLFTALIVNPYPGICQLRSIFAVLGNPGFDNRGALE